jgi:hypothetical protein
LSIVNFLELVACNHFVNILLDVSKTIGDPVLGDVRPRVDSQLRLGVLLPVLPAFTFLSFSTVSTSMFSKRLMVCANLGDLVLELVGGLDLEVLSVGSKDGLGSRLNLGLLGGLHVNIVLGVLGVSEGSGACFLLLHVKLLGLVLLPNVKFLKFGACSHLVSLLFNVVLDGLENVMASLGTAFCLVLAAFTIWNFSAINTFTLFLAST